MKSDTIKMFITWIDKQEIEEPYPLYTDITAKFNSYGMLTVEEAKYIKAIYNELRELNKINKVDTTKIIRYDNVPDAIAALLDKKSSM